MCVCLCVRETISCVCVCVCVRVYVCECFSQYWVTRPRHFRPEGVNSQTFSFVVAVPYTGRCCAVLYYAVLCCAVLCCADMPLLSQNPIKSHGTPNNNLSLSLSLYIYIYIYIDIAGVTHRTGSVMANRRSVRIIAISVKIFRKRRHWPHDKIMVA